MLLFERAYWCVLVFDGEWCVLMLHIPYKMLVFHGVC